VRVTADSDNAVNELGASGAFVGTQVQPANSAGAVGTYISRRGSADALQLLGEEVDVALGTGDLERGHAASVEEVVTGKGDRCVHALQLERSIGDEERSRRVDAQEGRELDVERDVLLVEGLGGELVEGLDGQGLRALAGVQGGHVVEHGDGAGGRGDVTDGSAGVVLETEAEEDVLERGTVGWPGQLDLTTVDGQNWLGTVVCAACAVLSAGNRGGNCQSSQTREEQCVEEHDDCVFRVCVLDSETLSLFSYFS
jgi:hypothetical protein